MTRFVTVVTDFMHHPIAANIDLKSAAPRFASRTVDLNLFLSWRAGVPVAARKTALAANRSQPSAIHENSLIFAFNRLKRSFEFSSAV
jgi:hypothetical protein